MTVTHLPTFRLPVDDAPLLKRIKNQKVRWTKPNNLKLTAKRLANVCQKRMEAEKGAAAKESTAGLEQTNSWQRTATYRIAGVLRKFVATRREWALANSHTDNAQTR